MTRHFIIRRIVPLLGIAALAGTTPNFAGASVIVSDSFTTGTVGGNISGRTPDTTDAPGTTWAQNGYPGYANDIVSSPSSSLQLGAEAGDGIALTGVTSTAYALSYRFNISGDTPNTGSGSGSGLGFFRNATTTGSPGSTAGFTGVLVSMAGAVSLLNNGASVATATISSFAVSATHSLSYDVNTTTGSISNLLLDGNGVTLTGTTTGIFKGSNINEFGITNNAGGYGNSYDYINNAIISAPTAVPEPASLGLLAVGSAGLLLAGRRKLRA